MFQCCAKINRFLRPKFKYVVILNRDGHDAITNSCCDVCSSDFFTVLLLLTSVAHSGGGQK